MAGVWNFSVLQLYSLDSSFAIGLARSAGLSFVASYNLTRRHFGLQNRFLGLQNRYLGLQNRFLQPPKSLFGCSWPPPSHFYGFGVDFEWILVVPGSKFKPFSWTKPMLLGSLQMHCQAQRLLVKCAKNPRKTEVFAIVYSC